jgi:hypothetical protein
MLVILSVLVTALILVPFSLAGSVTRSFSSSTVAQGNQINVNLTVSVTGETYYALDEVYPSGWTIISNGGLNSSESRHLKIAVYQSAANRVYTYVIQAPSTIGTYTWSGTYMFEGMSTEQNIAGSTQVTVQTACIPVTEICDGIDNDCDSSTDEGCDDDDDNYCDSYMTRATIYSCSGGTYCCSLGGNDCNDVSSSINPGAAETCDNIDNNCDGRTDYTTTPGDLTRSCGPQNQTGVCRYGTQACSAGTWGTCNGAVMPSQEVCDNLDNNCNGVKDDVSGGNSVATTHCQCYGSGTPLSQEVCPLNGIDDNCNGQIDETSCGCTPGNTQLCALQSGTCVNSFETCPSGGVWPGCNATTYLSFNSSYQANETSCDGKDNDCDGLTDENLTIMYYRDFDNDGYGTVTNSVQACSKPAGYVSNSGDCADTNSSIRPNATETCNGVDDNCNGNVDFNTVPGDLSCTGNITITADYYDGNTTNANNAPDKSRICDFILEKNIYGSIQFLQCINITYSANLNPPFARIENRTAGVNTTALTFLNIPARIRLYNLGLLNPVIYRDSSPCPTSICSAISYSGGNLTFSVTGFSVYFAKGSCSDGTIYDECSATKPKYCLNGVLVDRADICGCPSGYAVSGVSCIVQQDDDGGGGGSGGGAVCTSGDKIACKKTGVCEPSYQTCTNGYWGTCQGPAATTEVCDGIDNNCDGEIDETCMCQPGDTRVCGPSNDTGACAFGVSRCISASWGTCEGAVIPIKEICNGMDDDCDGQVDNSCANAIVICDENPVEGCVPRCGEGPLAGNCVCENSIKSSGFCCSNLFYEGICPQYIIAIGAIVVVIIIIGASYYIRVYKNKGGQPRETRPQPPMEEPQGVPGVQQSLRRALKPRRDKDV